MRREFKFRERERTGARRQLDQRRKGPLLFAPVPAAPIRRRRRLFFFSLSLVAAKRLRHFAVVVVVAVDYIHLPEADLAHNGDVCIYIHTYYIELANCGRIFPGQESISPFKFSSAINGFRLNPTAIYIGMYRQFPRLCSKRELLS